MTNFKLHLIFIYLSLGISACGSDSSNSQQSPYQNNLNYPYGTTYPYPMVSPYGNLNGYNSYNNYNSGPFDVRALYRTDSSGNSHLIFAFGSGAPGAGLLTGGNTTSVFVNRRASDSRFPTLSPGDGTNAGYQNGYQNSNNGYQNTYPYNSGYPTTNYPYNSSYNNAYNNPYNSTYPGSNIPNNATYPFSNYINPLLGSFGNQNPGIQQVGMLGVPVPTNSASQIVGISSLVVSAGSQTVVSLQFTPYDFQSNGASWSNFVQSWMASSSQNYWLTGASNYYFVKVVGPRLPRNVYTVSGSALSISNQTQSFQFTTQMQY